MRRAGWNHRRGFTLIEMLIVVGIIGVLLGLSLTILGYALRKKNETATRVLIGDLKDALNNYHFQENGLYPLQPGSSTKLTDDGSGTFAPKFYQSDCAALGSPPSGAESNKALVACLRAAGRFEVLQSRIVNGELLDYFGRPLIVRFLLIPHGSGKDTTLDEKVYIWSYGADGKNGVNAKATYANLGLPVYDSAEAGNMDGSPSASDDDLTSWR